MPADQFDAQIPSWEQLSAEARRDKIQAVRTDLLQPITKAGYEIRQRV